AVLHRWPLTGGTATPFSTSHRAFSGVAVPVGKTVFQNKYTVQVTDISACACPWTATPLSSARRAFSGVAASGLTGGAPGGAADTAVPATAPPGGDAATPFF